MTRQELIERWRSRLAAFKDFGAHIDGEATARQILSDLEGMADSYEDAEISLTQASEEGGVSTRQLSRLIKAGKLDNVGRPNAPRVRRKDIPRRAQRESSTSANSNIGIALLGIARQAVASRASQRGKNGTQG